MLTSPSSHEHLAFADPPEAMKESTASARACCFCFNALLHGSLMSTIESTSCSMCCGIVSDDCCVLRELPACWLLLQAEDVPATDGALSVSCCVEPAAKRLLRRLSACCCWRLPASFEGIVALQAGPPRGASKPGASFAAGCGAAGCGDQNFLRSPTPGLRGFGLQPPQFTENLNFHRGWTQAASILNSFLFFSCVC